MSNTKSNINSNNELADHWHYKIGINILPLDTGKKTYEDWSKSQLEAIPDELHEEWKRTGRYAQGITVMPGKVWRGQNKGLYFVGIDFDKEVGFKEFCNIFGANTSIDELKEKFIVEQHEGDPNSFHLYFYSEIPFTDKRPDTILGIEIKSNGKGLMCATPSYHAETNSNWHIIGTDSPITLKSEEATKVMSDINEVCKKYNVKYLNQFNESNNNNNNYTSKLPDELRELIKSQVLEISTDFQYRIDKGTRHDILLSFADSLLLRHKLNANTNVSNDQLKTFLCEVNQKLCEPEPLPQDDIQRIWRDALEFTEKKASEFKTNTEDHDKCKNEYPPSSVNVIIE